MPKPRLSLLAAFVLALAAGAPPSPRAADAPIATEDLGGGLIAVRWNDLRSYVLIGGDEAIVIDPLDPAAAAAIQAEVQQRGATVEYVVYTNDLKHRVRGGAVFADDGAEVVAHETCAAQLKAYPYDGAVLPNRTFTEPETLAVGPARLEMRHLQPIYGDCFTVLLAQPSNVMIFSDVIYPPAARLPMDPTLTNYRPHVILQFFDALEAWAAQAEVATVAGGVAEVRLPDGATETLPATGPVTLIADQRRFWEALLGAVETEFDKGVPAQQIGASMDKMPLEAFAGYSSRDIDIMTRRIYSLYRIGR